MGYYIELPENRGKALQLVKLHGAEIVSEPASFDAVPADMAIICIIDNVIFEGAGYCYCATEFERFREPDGRPRQWLLMDKSLAERLSGFKAAAE